MSPFALKRILRSPGRQIVALLVGAFLAVMACYLSSYREKQTKLRAQTYASANVLCVVTDVTGTQSDHLNMGYGAVQAVTNESFYRLPAYVKEPRFKKDFLLNETVPVIAVSRKECADALDPARGGGVTLFREDFFESDDSICLISEEAYRAAPDEVVSGIVKDPRADTRFLQGDGFLQVEWTVAGYYKGVGETVYLPFETGMNLCETVSNGLRVDAISFLAKDNTKLDELRDAASDVFGTVDPYAETVSRSFALTVHDEDLNTAVTAIEQNIRRMNWLIPVVFALTLASGFLIGFITTRSEKQTYALMRSIGTKKRVLLRGVLTEQLTLPFLACAIFGAVFLAPIPAVITFLLYAAGCIFSVIRAASVSPAQLLREQE